MQLKREKQIIQIDRLLQLIKDGIRLAGMEL